MLLRSFISYGSSRSNKHHRNRGFRSGSSSVIGCEASYLHHQGAGGSNFDDIKEEVAGGGSGGSLDMPAYPASSHSAGGGGGANADLSGHEAQGHHLAVFESFLKNFGMGFASWNFCKDTERKMYKTLELFSKLRWFSYLSWKIIICF